MKFQSEDSVQLLKHFAAGKNLKEQGYRGRFAPSPTGRMHLGNLRTALFSWLRARINNGHWILRIDDLDMARNRLEAFKSIQEDLLWLGLDWDGPVIFQSERIDLYSSAISALKKNGLLYACRCTRKFLAEIRSKKGSESIYPGICRDLGFEFSNSLGIATSWRLRVKEDFLHKCGDIIIKRSDGFIAYHLATVVDEIALGINEVVRGEDLSVAKLPQLAITESLGQKPCQYRYLPVYLDSEGRKLSKREGGKGLEYFKQKDMNPSQAIGELAASCDLVPEDAELTASELLSEFKDKKDFFETLFKA